MQRAAQGSGRAIVGGLLGETRERAWHDLTLTPPHVAAARLAFPRAY